MEQKAISTKCVHILFALEKKSLIFVCHCQLILTLKKFLKGEGADAGRLSVPVHTMGHFESKGCKKKHFHLFCKFFKYQDLDIS